MDKKSFKYDVDLTPENHVYYFITASLYCLTLPNLEEINFSKALHYFMNVMIIIYKNSENFEPIPPAFYDNIFQLIKAIHLNENSSVYKRENDYESFINKNGKSIDVSFIFK